MGLHKEVLGKFTETQPIVSRGIRNLSELQFARLPTSERINDIRLNKVSQMLFAESKNGKEIQEQPQDKTPRKDGFEPFVNPEPQDNQLFINGYNGNFAQQMELNRKDIERVLEIAHLEGKVVLTSLKSSRQRSIEANPDGSVTAKRSLFAGEKIEDDNKQNPLHKVITIPEGWRIEINDTRIREELEKEKLNGKNLQKQFIKRFNTNLRSALFESMLREKLTTAKDKELVVRSIFSLLQALNLFRGLVADPHNLSKLLPIGSIVAMDIGIYFIFNAVFNKILYASAGRKNIDNPLELFMPSVEVDKVARAAAFLAGKGRTLIKEVS